MDTHERKIRKTVPGRRPQRDILIIARKEAEIKRGRKLASVAMPEEYPWSAKSNLKE